MSRSNFLNLIVKVLREGNSAYLRVGQSGKYYNISIHYGDKSQLITDEEYTMSAAYAQMRIKKYQKLLDSSRA